MSFVISEFEQDSENCCWFCEFGGTPEVKEAKVSGLLPIPFDDWKEVKKD